MQRGIYFIQETRGFHSQAEREPSKTKSSFPRAIDPREWLVWCPILQGNDFTLVEGMKPDTRDKTGCQTSFFQVIDIVSKIFGYLLSQPCLARNWLWHWSSLILTTSHHHGQIDQWEDSWSYVDSWTNERLPSLDFISEFTTRGHSYHGYVFASLVCLCLFLCFYVYVCVYVYIFLFNIIPVY